MAAAKKDAQRGFTLIEILISLALITTMTLLLFSSLTPWLNLRHKIDTEHRMAEARDAIITAYRNKAMQVDSSQVTNAQALAIDTDGTNPLLSSPRTTATAQTGGGQQINTCGENTQAELLLTPFLSAEPNTGFRDGYGQFLCIIVSQELSRTIEGVNIYYHNVAIISSGLDGRLDPGTDWTTFVSPPTGQDAPVTLAGDDVAVLVNGFQIQYELYQETKARLDRVANLYSSYFTARFQGNPARDYSLDYFAGCNGWTPPTGAYANAALTSCLFDSTSEGNTVQLSGYTWATAASALATALGLGPEEQFSAWGTDPADAFYVANQALSGSDVIDQVEPQEPAVKMTNSGTNLPPYTALLRVLLPGPTDLTTPNYALKVVTGTY